MSQLTVCQCDRCGTEFAMSTQKLDDASEVTCPICERTVPVPQDNIPDDEDEVDEEL